MPRITKKERRDDSNEIHQYYRDVIACMPNLVYLLDKNCMLTGANNNFLKALGLKSIEELLGMPYKQMAKLTHLAEERMQVFKRDDINALLSETPIYDAVEAPVVDQEGRVIYYLSSRVPLLDSQKNVIGLVVILVDISERKNMEEQIEKLKTQLQIDNAKPQAPLKTDILPGNEKRLPKILMVEDSAIAQKAGQALLMQLDCLVDVADSGDKATELFKPGKYDLVFMDIGLEDTSGYVVSKKIRQMEKDTEYHVPIIALTGYEADVVKYDCDEFNMEGALTKPLTTEQAKQIIQHYVYHIDIPITGLKSIKGNAKGT